MSIQVTPDQTVIEGAPEPFIVKGPASPAVEAVIPVAEKRTVSQMVSGSGADVTFGNEKYVLPNKPIAKAEEWRRRFREEMREMFNAWSSQDENAGVQAALTFMDGTFILKATRLIHEWDSRFTVEFLENSATVGEILYAFLQIWTMINPFGSRNGKITKQILTMEM